MLSTLRPPQELSRESEGVMPTQLNTTWRLKSTFQFQREMFTRKKKLFKMLLYTTLTWRTQDPRVDTTLLL